MADKILLPEDYETMLWMDEMTMFVAGIITGTGLILNGLLGYLILTKTPPALRSYSVLLFNFALFDFLTNFSSVLTCQKIIFSGIALTYIFHGICGRVGPVFCFFWHCFGCHAMAHSQWILLSSFIYRWRILVSTQPTIKQMIMISIGIYSLSFFSLGYYFTDTGDTEALKKIMYRENPEYHYENQTIWGDLVVSGNLSILSAPTLYVIVYLCFPCIPIYAAIHHFRHQTLKILGGSALNMSEATKKSHRKMIKALTLQAMIPVFWLLAVLMFTLAEFHLISGTLAQNATFRIMECFPTSSPIVSLYFIAPYRKAIIDGFNRLRCAKKNTVTAAGSTTEATQSAAEKVADLA